MLGAVGDKKADCSAVFQLEGAWSHFSEPNVLIRIEAAAAVAPWWIARLKAYLHHWVGSLDTLQVIAPTQAAEAVVGTFFLNRVMPYILKLNNLLRKTLHKLTVGFPHLGLTDHKMYK